MNTRNPMTFKMHTHRWADIALKMPDDLYFDIVKKLAYHRTDLDLWQKDVERIMYFLNQQGAFHLKAALQSQINYYYHKTGDWK